MLRKGIKETERVRNFPLFFIYSTLWRCQASPKLKSAQIAPLIESVPPKGYGGTERIVGYLRRGRCAWRWKRLYSPAATVKTTAKLVRSPIAPYDWTGATRPPSRRPC